MANLKHKIEALLFSSARTMSVDEFRKLTRADPSDITSSLQELQEDFKTRESSISLVEDTPGTWKLSITDEHLPLVRKIVSKTELPKSLLETLAIIAWKAPVLQSEIIKMRTNKAYDDIKNLEHRSFITRTKKGRTKLIRLAQKFFDYFDIPPEKMQERFKKFEDVEQAIEKKEKEAEDAHKKIEEIKRLQDEEQAKLDKMGAIEIIDEDDEMESSDTLNKNIKIVKEKVGDLEVYDEPKDEATEETTTPEETDIPESNDQEKNNDKQSEDEKKEEPEINTENQDTTSIDDKEQQEKTDEEKQLEKEKKEIEKKIEDKFNKLIHPEEDKDDQEKVL